MRFKFKSPHKIRIIIALAVILFGLATIGFVFTPYGNPPQCEGIQHPDKGDNCIIGANIGAGIIFFFGLIIVWLGILGLTASSAYRAKQLHQQTKQRWLLAAVAILCITPFILWHFFITLPGNHAIERVEQEEVAFQDKYRSDFVAYNTPPNWNAVTKESSSVAYSENSSLALYLNQCETGRSDVHYGNGKTYFVFSGFKDNKCVFYIHTGSAEASSWDGLLRTKCIWNLDAGNDNTPIFTAGPQGIEFGDFLTKNCSSI